MVPMESSIPLNHATITTKNDRIFKRRKEPILIQSSTKRRFGNQNANQRHFSITNKQSDFHDFHGYAKPSRLIPAMEPRICTETLLQNVFSPSFLPKSQLLFKVKLRTSNIYGSGLSDLNSGVLLCLIDTEGCSVLQRIPVICEPTFVDSVEFETLFFQRGSVDEFIFMAPELGIIDALWLSVESGQWRVSDVSLTVADLDQSSYEENGNGGNLKCNCLQYEFEVDDILLGEGSNLSMVELRPRLVSEASWVDSSNLLSKDSSQSKPIPGTLSNEESMREYDDLKLSLLLYDAILIFAGATVVNFTAGETDTIAFFTGGGVGFLYLLLLQRSVDRLPPSTLASQNRTVIDRLFGGIKGPITSLALVVGLTLLAAKYGSRVMSSTLTSKELLIGMMGFLVCKVAVVLAAFKPMTLQLKGEK